MVGNHQLHPVLEHLAVCITFFYVPERLAYLSQIISNYAGIARKTDIYIVTNVLDTNLVSSKLPNIPAELSINFFTPTGTGHPYFLTWSHREIFRKLLHDGDVSHFLYTEDDLLFDRSNVIYWLKYRDALRNHGLIPSFIRVELHQELGWVSSDCKKPINPNKQPKRTLADGTQFIGMKYPYQGMYFLDRDLMDEFYNSPAMSPDFGKWNIREKAAQGLTFVNVPEGFTSRNVLLVDAKTMRIPQETWIHHLPNNYANDPNAKFGKLSMQYPGVFKSHLKPSSLQRFLKRFVTLKVKCPAG